MCANNASKRCTSTGTARFRTVPLSDCDTLEMLFCVVSRDSADPKTALDILRLAPDAAMSKTGSDGCLRFDMRCRTLLCDVLTSGTIGAAN